MVEFIPEVHIILEIFSQKGYLQNGLSIFNALRKDRYKFDKHERFQQNGTETEKSSDKFKSPLSRIIP